MCHGDKEEYHADRIEIAPDRGGGNVDDGRDHDRCRHTKSLIRLALTLSDTAVPAGCRDPFFCNRQ